MTTEKEKHSVKFSHSEMFRFLRIMEKKGRVIIADAVSHDVQSNRLKEDAWTEVMDAFNASRDTGSVLRSKNCLKNLWLKIKTEVMKSHIQKNGSGKGPSKDMVDPILEFIANLSVFGSSADESPNAGIEPNDGNAVVTIKQEKLPEKSNLKRRCPTASDNKQSEPGTSKSSMNSYDEGAEKFKFETEKRAILELKKQQMIEEHNYLMREQSIKIEILQAVLRKVREKNRVDLEVMEIVSYL